MYKVALIFALLAIAAQSGAKEFRLDLLENEQVNQVYERSRALLTPGEIEFLEEILAADDIIMERQKRGIVDQILAAISGVAGGFVGGSATSAPATAAPPTARMESVGGAAGQAMAPAPAQMASANDNHLFQQISKVITSSGTRNVSGIVDEALKIGTPAPVRELVNGIIAVSYCNGIRRLLGRC